MQSLALALSTMESQVKPELNQYYNFEGSEIYLKRYGAVVVNTKVMPCIVVSHISHKGHEENVRKVVPKPQSTGFMDRLMTLIEARADQVGFLVVIENIMNEWLPEWFERRGYEYTESRDMGLADLPSMYRQNACVVPIDRGKTMERITFSKENNDVSV